MNAFSFLFKNLFFSLLFVLIHTSSITAAPAPLKVATQPSLIGKVFNDINGNGYQDMYEEGLAGIRLATVTGLVIHTDGYGRFNVPDALGETQSWGRNFILKLDHASLPQGSLVTTENPRVIRFSNFGLNKVNFGVRLP